MARALVVLDMREKAKILPGIHYPERWPVIHVSGDLHSPQAIYYKQVLLAKKKAVALAQEKHEIHLKSLQPPKEEKPKQDDSSNNTQESGVREGGERYRNGNQRRIQPRTSR